MSYMRNRIIWGTAVLAVLAGALFLLLKTQSGGNQRNQYELLTILGDVALDEDAASGRWSVAGMGKPVTRLNEQEIEALAKLETLPYLQGSRTAPVEENVTVYDSTKAFRGVNLYTAGHAAEAYAMDMNGGVLHTWRYDIGDVWPEVPHTVHSTFWRRVHWYPNGDILAIYEGIGIVKLDRDSNLLWAYRGGCHHEAFVNDQGDIFVLTRRAEILSRLNPDKPVLLDAITVLNRDGKPVAEYPLLECFENSPFKTMLRGMRREGDIFHTNTVSILDGSLAGAAPYYKKGNALISLLKLDIVAIVELGSRTVAWAESGRNNRLWQAQHDPKLLAGGNLLLFDNVGQSERSKVLEYDPVRQRVIWIYAGGAGGQLFSRTCGTSQRLANGNTLITESDNGRALEVTPDKEIVWEFYNPHRAGEHSELIATLFELKRVDWDTMRWLRNDAEH